MRFVLDGAKVTLSSASESGMGHSPADVRLPVNVTFERVVITAQLELE